MSQLHSAENLAKVVSQSEPSKLTPIEAAHKAWAREFVRLSS